MTNNSSSGIIAFGGVVLFPPSKAGIKKMVWLILLIAVIYYAYLYLLAPPKVTLLSYKQIREGMDIKQVESALGTGYLRALFSDVTEAMEVKNESKGEEILSEFAIASREFTERMTKPPSQMSGIVKGTVTSSEGTSNFDSMGLLNANCRREIVSNKGTWKTRNTYVPSMRVILQASAQRKGGMTRIELSGQYNFCDFLMDVTVNNNPGKLIRNGVVYFAPEIAGGFKSWKGNAGRVITILFTGGKVSYLTYRGPAEDFADLPPLVNTEKPIVKETASAPASLKIPESVDKIEQTSLDLIKIRADLVAEFNHKFPVLTVGATVKFYQRGISVTGTIEKITASSVVISEQADHDEIPFGGMDIAMRLRLDPIFRAQAIEQAIQKHLKKSSGTLALPNQQ